MSTCNFLFKSAFLVSLYWAFQQILLAALDLAFIH